MFPSLRKKIPESSVFDEGIIKMFSFCYDNFPYSVGISTAEGKIVYANESLWRMMGYEKKENLPLDLNERYAELSDRQRLFLELRKNGEAKNFYTKFLKKDGSLVDAILNIRILSIKGSEFFLAIISDPKDFLVKEEKLKTIDSQFNSLYVNSRDAIMLLAPPDWKFVVANPYTIKMFNLEKEEDFTALSPWDISPEIQPDGSSSGESAKKMIEKAVLEGSNFFEWRHKRSNGEEFPATVFLSKISIHGKDHLRGIVRDISEQKNAEESLRKREEEFSLIYQNIPDAVAVIGVENDENFTLLSANPVFEKNASLAGFSKESLVGKSLSDILPESLKSRIMGKLKETIWEKKTIRWQDSIFFNNEEKFGDISTAPLYDKAGNCVRIFVVIHDTTSLIQSGKTLREFERNTRKKISDVLPSLSGEKLSISDENISSSDILELLSAIDKMIDNIKNFSSNLQDSEMRYRRLFESAQDGIILFSLKDEKIFDINPYLQKMLGYGYDYFLGKKFCDLKIFGDKESLEEIVEEIKKKKYFRKENIFLHKGNGSPLEAEVVGNVYTVGSNDIVQINIRDITEREKNERLVHNLAEIVEASPEAIYSLDLLGKIMTWNKGAERLYGYSVDEVLGRSICDLVTKEERSGVEEKIGMVVRDSAVNNYEILRKQKDGKDIILAVTLAPIHGIGKEVVGISSIARDITLKKREEESQIAKNIYLENVQKAMMSLTEDLSKEKMRLEESKAKVEAIIKGINEGVFVVGKTGVVTLFNPAAEKISGFSALEIIDKKCCDVLEFYSDEEGLSRNEFIKKSILGEGIVPAEPHSVLKQKNGKFLPVSYSISLLRDEKGATSGAVVAFSDDSEKRRIDTAKTEFVALASHQLRTPLSTINWFIEMLLSGDAGVLGPKQKDYVEEAYHSSKRMSELVGRLLNISRIEMGTFIIEPEPGDIASAIDEALSGILPLSVNKHLSIQKKIEVPASSISIDKKLFGIVLENLLSNSIAYTPEGGKIFVSACVEGDDIVLRVSDNGVGIPKEDQLKTFTKLYRGSNVAEIDPDGSGIGLYVVKMVVETWGGKISFESPVSGSPEESLGKGTVFIFTIPLSGMKKKTGTKHLS